MRIGEVLVAAGLLSEQQLDEALRAQIMWGGRLGTNLVELGFITLDDVSRALGKQHALPAALGSHFSRADRDLQNQLPAELAEKFECLPLVRAGKRIVLAATTPLSDVAVALVAGQLDVNRQMIVQSVAAEMRVRFQLERVYDIPRGQRFLRSRGSTQQSQVFSLPELRREEASAVMRMPTEADALDAVPVLELPDARSAPHDPNVDRRTYLHTLADMLSKHPDKESVMARVQRARPIDAVGRLAIGSMPLPARKSAVIADTINEAMAEIVLSRDRDELATRVIGTVARFIPESHSALLLIVRGEAAVSDTSFCRDGTELPALAVPLDHPGLVPAAVRRKKTCRSASGDLTPIDFLLLASLGLQYGDLVVAPFRILDHVIGMLVLATEHRAALARVDDIAAAAGDGFKRLMKRAAA